MRFAPWAGLEFVCRRLLSRRAPSDDIDVRDPLLDLTICPTCGTDLSEKENAA